MPMKFWMLLKISISKYTTLLECDFVHYSNDDSTTISVNSTPQTNPEVVLTAITYLQLSYMYIPCTELHLKHCVI